ncbi:hypothetical protein [Halalkalicoccus sp. NIPERK01]|uniref:hypothetical protein n=1 Tax=Halalkalicoccus sp. NIPERK01 TaxID=3053469 RepID=UPI00256EF8D2|nr:hypothetical protein [Halalkalicoccus sp. NIPERK01]MDL5361434.1 hypothetical protein [Halalkalicoccus sp. NIPERK01]
MVADDGGEAEPSAGRPGTVGVLARAAVAAVAVVLGVVWIVRVAVLGSTLGGGLLFEMLPPLVLLYFGIVYLRTQRRALREGS